jgi:RNA polymerase sigma-70 factor (ECF subfamily)
MPARGQAPYGICVSGLDSPDAVLLAGIEAGDELAARAVYEQHSPAVFGLARRVIRDEQLARDVTQEVFAHLCRRPGCVDLDRGSLRVYLAVLTHRRAIDEVRRRERRARAETACAAAAVADGPEVEVVDTAAQQWRRLRLARELAGLPASQRVAIELAYFDGLTYKQVAERLAIPEGTAKSRLRLGMRRLRMQLGEDVRTGR